MLMPKELRKYSFTYAIRGYSVSEVEEYIGFLIERYEEIYRERNELEKKCNAAVRALEETDTRSTAPAEITDEAKRIAGRMLLAAETQKKRIMRDAEEYADRIIAEADAHVAEQARVLEAMRQNVLSFRDDLYQRYSHQIDQIEAFAAAAIAVGGVGNIAPAEEIRLPDAPARPSIPHEESPAAAETPEEETVTLYMPSAPSANGEQEEPAEEIVLLLDPTEESEEGEIEESMASPEPAEEPAEEEPEIQPEEADASSEPAEEPAEETPVKTLASLFDSSEEPADTKPAAPVETLASLFDSSEEPADTKPAESVETLASLFDSSEESADMKPAESVETLESLFEPAEEPAAEEAEAPEEENILLFEPEKEPEEDEPAIPAENFELLFQSVLNAKEEAEAPIDAIVIEKEPESADGAEEEPILLFDLDTEPTAAAETPEEPAVNLEDGLTEEVSETDKVLDFLEDSAPVEEAPLALSTVLAEIFRTDSPEENGTEDVLTEAFDDDEWDALTKAAEKERQSSDELLLAIQASTGDVTLGDEASPEDSLDALFAELPAGNTLDGLLHTEEPRFEEFAPEGEDADVKLAPETAPQEADKEETSDEALLKELREVFHINFEEFTPEANKEDGETGNGEFDFLDESTDAKH